MATTKTGSKKSAGGGRSRGGVARRGQKDAPKKGRKTGDGGKGRDRKSARKGGGPRGEGSIP